MVETTIIHLIIFFLEIIECKLMWHFMFLLKFFVFQFSMLRKTYFEELVM
jgi:hypothetical protein